MCKFLPVQERALPRSRIKYGNFLCYFPGWQAEESNPFCKFFLVRLMKMPKENVLHTKSLFLSHQR